MSKADGFSSRLMFRSEGALMSYMYYPGKSADHNCGEDWFYDVNAQAGTWHTINLYVKMNTPGALAAQSCEDRDSLASHALVLYRNVGDPGPQYSQSFRPSERCHWSCGHWLNDKVLAGEGRSSMHVAACGCMWLHACGCICSVAASVIQCACTVLYNQCRPARWACLRVGSEECYLLWASLPAHHTAAAIKRARSVGARMCMRHTMPLSFRSHRAHVSVCFSTLVLILVCVVTQLPQQRDLTDRECACSMLMQ